MSLANVKPDAFIRTKGHVRRPPALLVVSGLILFLLLAIMLAATVGAAGIPLSRLPAAPTVLV